MQAGGFTLSPIDYPHAAEDIELAVQTFLRQSDLRSLQPCVISSLSPWIELTLLRAGLPSVSTVDYNTPVVPSNESILAVTMTELPKLYGRSGGLGVFDLIVAFSGLEHDGLGRYVRAPASMQRPILPPAATEEYSP